MFKQIGKKDLFSRLILSLAIICFVLSSVPLSGYAGLTIADKLRPQGAESSSALGDIAGELKRIGGGNEGTAEVTKIASQLNLKTADVFDFQNAEQKIAQPIIAPLQEFSDSMNKVSAQDKIETVAPGRILPAGTIEVDAKQLVGLDANLPNYGLKIKNMKITPLKGNLNPQDLLGVDSFKHLLNISFNGAIGSWVFAGGGKEIKEIADRNAVFFGEAGIRNAVTVDTKLAIGVSGDEGKRDVSFSLDVGSIYYSGYGQDVRKAFTTKAEFDAEMQRLKDLGVKVKGKSFVGDFLEVTNGQQDPKAITNPLNSWSLAALFDNPIDNPFVNDDARITGFSYNAPTDAGVAWDDLPSVALPKIAKANGIDIENPEAFAEWMNQIAVFTLGERETALRKNYETDKHRHDAIFKDVQALQEKFPGLKLVLNGDGDAMPRIVASAGLKVKYGEKEYTFVVVGRSGTAEAVTSSLVAKNVPGGQFAHRYVSNEATKADYRSANAGKFTEKEMLPFVTTGTAEAVYKDERTAQSVQGNGLVTMTSVNGAEARIFGDELANLLQGIQTTYTSDKAGELTTSTFVVAPDGSILVVTAQFETEDVFKTRAAIKSASPEAGKYVEKTNFNKNKRISDLLKQRQREELTHKAQYADEVEELLDTQFHSRPEAVKKNIEKIYRAGLLGGWGVKGKGSGKLFILPIDQGGEHGPFKTFAKVPENADIWAQVGLAYAMGMNGFVAHPGAILEIAHKWADKVPLIAKINMSIPVGGDKKKQHSMILGQKATIKALAEAGVAGVGFTIYEGSEEFNQQMAELQEMIDAARENGLAVIVWSYPRGTIAEQDETSLNVSADAAYTAIVAQADIVKIKPSAEFFIGEQTLDEYKAMFAKVFGQAYDPNPKKEEDKVKHKDDEKNMDWLRFGKLSDKDLENIFAKVNGHEYDAKGSTDVSKDDKKNLKALKSKIRPEEKELLIKEGYDFRSLEERTRLIAFFGALANRQPLIFSGGPAKEDWDVLMEIASVHLGGAKGSIVGRNMFQRGWVPSIKLGQEILAIIRASTLQEFDSAHELVTYALQIELPKIKAELNLPAAKPAFGKYYEPDITRGKAGQEAQAVSVVKPSKALIIDSRLVHAGGLTEILKAVSNLDDSYAVAFYGAGAEAVKILSDVGINIITADDVMQVTAKLKDEMGIAPAKIKLVTTVVNEKIKQSGISQKVISSLDTVSVLVGITKAIAELNDSSEARNIFTNLINGLVKSNVVSQTAVFNSKILELVAKDVETVQIESNVQKTEDDMKVIKEIAAQIGV
ncbi:MAG: hypothetical protein V1670_01235 [Candidatus Omnitrophota bacterium]